MSYSILCVSGSSLDTIFQVNNELDLSYAELARISIRQVDAVARKYKLPIYDISIFSELHRFALPLIENRLKYLLSNHEHLSPMYYFLARDAEEMATALSVSSMGFPLSGRVRSVVYSKINRDIMSTTPARSGDRSKHLQYLDQCGINKNRLYGDSNAVMIDTALVGTLLDHFLDLFKEDSSFEASIPSTLNGYLICKDDSRSRYNEIIINDDKEVKFYEAFKKNVISVWLSNSDTVLGNLQKFGMDRMESFVSGRQINWALATYLQMMPKFYPRSSGYEFKNNRWIPVYEKRKSPSLDHSLVIPDDNAVDPIAACKLRILTIKYFSKSEVINRLLG